MDPGPPPPAAQGSNRASRFDPAETLARLRYTIARVRRRFARQPCALQTRAGVEALDTQSVHPRWIVARSLCLYRSEDFADVPRNRRDAAVTLKIPVWSPFESTGHHCVWSGSRAMVWFWDESGVEVNPVDLGLPPTDAASGVPANVRLLPETVLYPKQHDGPWVQQCREGFDLQFWRDGALLDSLWLPAPPDAQRVQAFLGQLGAATAEAGHTTAAMPASLPVSTPAFQPEPWISPLTPRAWLIANERALVIAALTLAAAAAALQEARYWRYHLAQLSDAAELRTIDRELAPVLDARGELLAVQRRSEFLAGIANHPSQAEVMVQVDRALPDDDTEFGTWRYQQNDLSVVLAGGPEQDAVAIIAGLQAVPTFADVEPGRTYPDGFEVDLRIDTGTP